MKTFHLLQEQLRDTRANAAEREGVLQNEVASLKDTVADLGEKCAQVQINASERENEVEALQATVVVLKEQLLEADKKVDAIVEMFDDIDDNKEGERANQKETEEETFEEELEDFGTFDAKEIDSLSNEISKVNTMVDKACSTDNSQIQREYKTLTEEETLDIELQNSKDQILGDNGNVEGVSNNLVQSDLIHDSNIDNGSGSCHCLRTGNDELTTKFNAMKDRAILAEKEVEKLKLRIASDATQIDNLTNDNFHANDMVNKTCRLHYNVKKEKDALQ